MVEARRDRFKYETAISEAQEGIATTKSELEALADGIKALDKSVADATEQRKEEHADYTELMANDASAKELLAFAQNRLNKFYKPEMSCLGLPRTGVIVFRGQFVVACKGLWLSCHTSH